MMSSRLSEVQKALGSEAGVRLVSISVDPEKDTPDVLKMYAERFKAGEHWYFLTGQKDAIYTLARDAFKLPLADAPKVRVYGPGGALLGSAHVAGGELIAGRLLSPVEVGAAFPAPLAACPRIEESESLSS